MPFSALSMMADWLLCRELRRKESMNLMV